MNHRLPRLALAALVLAGATPHAAAADETVMCHPGPTLLPLDKCFFYNHYIVDYPWAPQYRIDGPDDCPRVSTSTGVRAAVVASSTAVSLCVPQSMAPPFPTLECTRAVVLPGVPTKRVIDCAAYPTSPRLQYSWLTTGAVVQNYPNDPLSSTREFTCTGTGSGTIRVTITSPFGPQSSRTASVSCANPLPQQ